MKTAQKAIAGYCACATAAAAVAAASKLSRVGRTSFRARRLSRRRRRRRVTEIKSAAFKCSTENSNSNSSLVAAAATAAAPNFIFNYTTPVRGTGKPAVSCWFDTERNDVGAYASGDPAPDLAPRESNREREAKTQLSCA